MKRATSAPRRARRAASVRVTGSRASSASVVLSGSAGVGSTSRQAPTISTRLWAELAGHELQQQQRRLVRRVQVVEHQHERLRVRDALQERGQGVEQPEARALGLGRRRRRQVGDDVAQLRQQLGEVRRPGPELRPQRGGLGRADVGAQRLHPRPVGGRAAGLPAAADEHQRAARSRPRGELLGQPALADARLADEQEQAPAAGEGIVERRRSAPPARARARRTRRRAAAARRRRRHRRARDRAADPASRIARSSSRSRSPGSIPSSSAERRGARRGRPAARRPAGRSGTARASAAPGSAPDRDARRPAARAARPARRGGRAPARPRSAARVRRRADPPAARSRAARTARRPGPPAARRATAPAPPRASTPPAPGRPAASSLRPSADQPLEPVGVELLGIEHAARSRARASRSRRAASPSALRSREM